MNARRNGLGRTFALLTFVMALVALPAWSQTLPSCANKMWIPDGSVATTNPDGSINFDTPSNYAYFGYDSGGTIAMLGGPSKCSCTCTSSEPGKTGTCSPSISGGDCSCTAKDGCTGCTLETGSASSSAVYERGGYLDLDAGVRFATATDTDLPAGFPALLDIPEVREAVQRFVDYVYQGAPVPEAEENGVYVTAPPGHAMAAVSVFGRVVAMVVPENAVAAASTASGSAGSCSCTEGTCDYWSSLLPPKTYSCHGTCTGTCTLSIGNTATGTGTFVSMHGFTSYSH